MPKILVTQSFMPPFEEYSEYMKQLWESGYLTNGGPLATQLEEQLTAYLEVPHVLFAGNGTIAMQLALRMLHAQGEVITTPYTYVATTSAIMWENCTPVYADIDPHTLCLDPAKVEPLITPQTVAIMPVHVYGIPCDVEGFERLSQKYNIPVIYDAAHAFGVRVHGRSLLSFGTVSTLSFHATKLFHTGEGGAMIVHDQAHAASLKLLRSFGHVGDEHFQLGINGKNSEFHAAMGLTNLRYIGDIIAKRAELSDRYDAQLAEPLKSKKLRRPTLPSGTTYNYAYYPVIFDTHERMLEVRSVLESADIIPRRYFFPSLNTLDYTPSQPCPISESVAQRVLCLPLYYQLDTETVDRIAQLVCQACEATP